MWSCETVMSKTNVKFNLKRLEITHENKDALIRDAARLVLLLAVAGLAQAGPIASQLRPPLFFEPQGGQAGVQFVARGAQNTLFLMEGARALLRYRSANFQMNLLGAAARPRAVGVDPLSGTISDFAGNDRSRWRTNITAYSAVRFERVYPGIDLIYHFGEDQLEYDF